MKIWLIILISLPAIVAEYDCTNNPDAIFEAGCKSFIKCENGTAVSHECGENMVYNPVIKNCDHPENVLAPCGHMMDCTMKADGHYADLDQECRTYYTCVGGVFFGHNFCPQGLVYHEEIDVCDYPHSVPKPCGLLPPKTQ